MKKLIAFITALVLFLCTILGFHVYSKEAIKMNNNDFGTWINQAKFSSPDGIKANLNDSSLVIFGSSEFQHGKKTIYHPKSMFKGFSFNPMLIGAGYYQSLGHAIELAAIGNNIPNKKVVLFLSPTWFKEEGVVDKAFASRFFESNYIGLLKNKNISIKTKKYISKRVTTLLSVDPTALKRINLYNRELLDRNGSVLDNINYNLYSRFLTEKSHQGLIIQAKLNNIKHDQNKDLMDKEIDWNKYLKKAEISGEKRNKNPFFMSPKSLKKLEFRMTNQKGTFSPAVNFGFAKSPEYNDFRCFLDICKELNLKVLVVGLPVNGYWFDYNNFPAAKRAEYYKNMKEITAQYGVELADFSDQEYTKYFFEDGVHLGGKGWVTIDECIYNFYREGQK